jgi:hypothetical protein
MGIGLAGTYMPGLQMVSERFSLDSPIFSEYSGPHQPFGCPGKIRILSKLGVGIDDPGGGRTHRSPGDLEDKK